MIRRLVLTGIAAASAFVIAYLLSGFAVPVVLGWLQRFSSLTISRDLADQIKNVGAFGFGLSTSALVGRLFWRVSQTRDESLADAAQRLATRAYQRVTDSPVLSAVNRGLPMRLRFRSLAEGEVASRESVMGTPWGGTPIEGHVSQIADNLRQLPLRRLVVKGAPGAGKSVLALILADRLLSGWRADEPVPVLLPISWWDPKSESIEAFVARRIRYDYGIAESVAHRLVTEPRAGASAEFKKYWVVPILDGFDEIAQGLRARAMHDLEAFAETGHAFVVTSRVSEWDRAFVKVAVLIGNVSMFGEARRPGTGPAICRGWLAGLARAGAPGCEGARAA